MEFILCVKNQVKADRQGQKSLTSLGDTGHACDTRGTLGGDGTPLWGSDSLVGELHISDLRCHNNIRLHYTGFMDSHH